MPRRKPFSNKQKKQQLQEKRAKRKEKAPKTENIGSEGSTLHSDLDVEMEDEEQVVQEGDQLPDLEKLNSQPRPEQWKAGLGGGAAKHNPNRFNLHFGKESNEEIERRKLSAKTTTLVTVLESNLESSVEEVYVAESGLDIPRRPPWTYEMSKEELETTEEREFEAYLKKIHSKYTMAQLSYFEHNLETWRQLWRVLEMSDVILLITDIRHPALHFPPALYAYVVEELKKRMVLVLNKVDLVPPSVVVAWRHYFLSHFPGLDVICFTSYPSNPPSLHSTGKVQLKKHRRRGKLPSAVGPWELLNVVQKMYSGKVDLSSWRNKLDEATPYSEEATPRGATHTHTDYDNCSSEEDEVEYRPTVADMSSSPLDHQDTRTSEGVLTIGMVGHPNVGKSSIINGLMRKKLVSISRTPGHTKHFQTLYLTPTLRLCDCPGLVFPSLVDKQLQILSGIFPVAQVREPYTVVGYLACRTSLIQQLQLVHPDEDSYGQKKTAGRKVGDWELPELEEGVESRDRTPSDVIRGSARAEREWTAWEICDAWAIKRGYFTSRAARPDTYKAANSILRLAVEGRITMFFRPPGFTEMKVEWEEHPEVADMVELQRAGMREGEQEQDSTRQEAVGTTREPVPVTKRGGRGEEYKDTNQFAALLDMDD